MAVHDQSYRGYDGPLAPDRRRFVVVARYALLQLFALRVLPIALVLSLMYPIGCAAYIYIVNNLDLLRDIGINVTGSAAVGPRFFLTILYVQGLGGAFLLTLVAGPLLVTPDVRNGALPLYLSRPLSRPEYLLGKSAVLAGLLSAVTWIPGLLLFLLQGVFAGAGWMTDNARIAWAFVAGSWLLILTLSALALTASALLKWRPAATAAIFGGFLLGGPLARTIEAATALGPRAGDEGRALTGTTWGGLVDLSGMVQTAWEGLFAAKIRFAPALLPPLTSTLGLLLFWGLCLYVLRRRLRAFEVVR